MTRGSVTGKKRFGQSICLGRSIRKVGNRKQTLLYAFVKSVVTTYFQIIQIHGELEVAVHKTYIDQKYYLVLVKPSNHISICLR